MSSNSNSKKGKSRQVNQDADLDDGWATIDRVLLSRTLHLHSLSPINVPTLHDLPSSSTSTSTSNLLTPQLFNSLSQQLISFLNLRLSDPISISSGFQVSSDGASINDSSTQQSNKRKRIEVNKVGNVRMGFIQDLIIDDEDVEDAGDGEEERKLWCIEIEMGKPSNEQDQQGEGSTTTNPSSSSKKNKKSDNSNSIDSSQPQMADLCHLIFVPSLSSSKPSSKSSSKSSLNYPLLLTKSSTISSPLISKFILQSTLEWFSTRFDCRISSSSSSSTFEGSDTLNINLENRLKGSRLSSLFESIIGIEIDSRKNTRNRNGGGDGDGDGEEVKQKPIELSWSLPSNLFSDPSEKKNGSVVGNITPKLNQLTLTVPFKVCLELLNGNDSYRENHSTSDDAKVPLLPVLSSYLSTHTSLPLHLFTLNRVAAAGINLGSGRIKIESVTKLGQNDEDEGLERDRKRLLVVLKSLSSLA